jgi:hypothetical protein
MSRMQDLYGYTAEFKTEAGLVAATKKTRQAGYREIEVYSPFPIEELNGVLDAGRSQLSFFTFIGGCIAAASIYFIEYYSSVIDYPINVGGRPYHSWPAFLPATVELAILGAALATVIGMLLLNGLPKLIHPIFNVLSFKEVTRDRFFLCIKANDSCFDPIKTYAFLGCLGPVNVHRIIKE